MANRGHVKPEEGWSNIYLSNTCNHSVTTSFYQLRDANIVEYSIHLRKIWQINEHYYWSKNVYIQVFAIRLSLSFSLFPIVLPQIFSWEKVSRPTNWSLIIRIPTKDQRSLMWMRTALLKEKVDLLPLILVKLVIFFKKIFCQLWKIEICLCNLWIDYAQLLCSTHSHHIAHCTGLLLKQSFINTEWNSSIN